MTNILTEEQIYLQKNNDSYRRTMILSEEQRYRRTKIVTEEQS